MSECNAPICLWLVTPKGFADKLAIVLATDKHEALVKALESPDLAELARQGSQLQVLDITSHFGKQGFIVSVVKQGMFH